MRVMAVFHKVSSSVTGRYLRSSFSNGTMAPSLYLSVQEPSMMELMGDIKCSSTSSGRCKRCSLVIPLGPPHLPAWHLRSAVRSSSVVSIFERIVRKSAVSSVVGSILCLIVCASFGASSIWVSEIISSFRSSRIQAVVFVERMWDKESWFLWSSSMMVSGASMS